MSMSDLSFVSFRPPRAPPRPSKKTVEFDLKVLRKVLDECLIAGIPNYRALTLHLDRFQKVNRFFHSFEELSLQVTSVTN